MIIINGKTYEGSSVSIMNGTVIIDGKTVDEKSAKDKLFLEIKGSVTHLTTDMDVNCLDVIGDVKAGQNVNCGSIGGNVEAGMNINCGSVMGNVKAGLNINHG